MKANNLTISIPSRKTGPRCDKNCPYCISLMTPSVPFNYDAFFRNLDKARYLATATNANSVLLTGKGEPCLNFHLLVQAAMKFPEFPLELQTNGLWLNKHPSAIKQLQAVGVNTIAISTDQLWQASALDNVISEIKNLSMTSRVSLNITDMISKDIQLKEGTDIMKALIIVKG